MGQTIVLGGVFKGQRIPALEQSTYVRPILAQFKKSLFDILKNSILDCAFLDLFAGTGSVGIEAFSRGAKEVFFIEQNQKCAQNINHMIQKISQGNPEFFKGKECRAYRADVLRGVGWLGKEFDIIFSGAPYVDEHKKPLYFVSKLLVMLERENLLKKNGLFIAQRHKKEPFEVPASWNLSREEQYGDTTLSFFKRL